MTGPREGKKEMQNKKGKQKGKRKENKGESRKKGISSSMSLRKLCTKKIKKKGSIQRRSRFGVGGSKA